MPPNNSTHATVIKEFVELLSILITCVSFRLALGLRLKADYAMEKKPLKDDAISRARYRQPWQ